MKTKIAPFRPAFGVSLLLLILFAVPIFPWTSPIRVASGSTLLKPVVAYAPSGKIYVIYQANREIHLSSYNGSSVAFEKRISDGSMYNYEPFLYITRRGHLHAVWIECSSYESDTQYVKYSSNNGSGWTTPATLRTMTITGTIPGGYVTRKVEDLRIAADENDNVFVTFMTWPAARCIIISKYGGTVAQETWPMTGRSKHPDVAVDANNVHLAWQQLWGSTYTIAYSRRANSSGAKWGGAIDVRDGNHRPRLASDPTRLLHIIMMNDYNIGVPRDTYYKYWTGSGFSSRYLISNDGARAYHEINVAALSSENVFVSEWTGNTCYFNWKQNGKWTGHKKVPTPGISIAFTSSALSTGNTAVVAVAHSDSAIYIVLSKGESPDPDPPGPEPEPDPNLPPSARFTFSPLGGLFPLTVTCNASNSKDSDGTITSYFWDFGDGATGSGKVASHVYRREGRFEISLRVTDDDGATATATGELEVFGLAPPLNLRFQRHENRNLFSMEYLYRVTWDRNPRNEEIGAVIVSYKIYRREVGKGGYGHFYTLPAGNQGSFEYLDRTLGATPRVYEYAVSAVDSQGRESPWAQNGLNAPPEAQSSGPDDEKEPRAVAPGPALDDARD
jgi:PKD repeat protein